MVTLRSKKTMCGPSVASEKKAEVHLVTGGGGFAGFSLGKRLAAHGHHVMLIDIQGPIWTMKPGMEFIMCDLTNGDLVSALFTGVDCVYHMASYGMSGREQLNRERIVAVNIGGTDTVIKACLQNDVQRLVYTSTYNVIFGGQTIEAGDESLPYLPLDKHPDHYSRTKSIAEQNVLAANGKRTHSGHVLHTCALRLAAIYGPGEQRHIPRIVDYIERGLFCVKYGTDTLQDFLHVDNLVQAHQLAGEGLALKCQHVAAGECYSINDGEPINTLTFFSPLVEGLGYSMPSIQLPVKLVYFIAFLTEWLHYLLSWMYNFQPLLTRTEVYKTGITHHFSITKVCRDLGYKPTVQNDLSKVVQHYVQAGHRKPETKGQSAIVYCLVNVIFAVIFAVVLLSALPLVK